MPGSAFASAIYRELFNDAEIADLFSDKEEIRAMLLVEGRAGLGSRRHRPDPARQCRRDPPRGAGCADRRRRSGA